MMLPIQACSNYANAITQRAFGDCQRHATQALFLWWFLFLASLGRCLLSFNPHRAAGNLSPHVSNNGLPNSLLALWCSTWIRGKRPTGAIYSGASQVKTLRIPKKLGAEAKREEAFSRAALGSKHSPKLLILACYPIVRPRHGGQLRVRAIANLYKACGWSVEIAGVAGNPEYEKQSSFVSFAEIMASEDLKAEHPFMHDYAIGTTATKEPFFSSLSQKIPFTPDLIHVEQPWLCEFAQKYRERFCPSAKIIYSSHNCEWSLKNDILGKCVEPEILAQSVMKVRSCEEAACAGADGIVTVTESDIAFLGANIGKPVLVANNGIDESSFEKSGDRPEWLKGTGKYCLFCASAHPPNMDGFFEMLGGGFGSLDSDQSLVVAGGAGPSIAADPRLASSANLTEKLIVAGIIDPDALAQLLMHAHCIIIPITIGSGTNLKTAEALLAKKHIIATPKAMRGFERFSGGSGIAVCHTPAEFKKSLRKAMQSPPLELSELEARQRYEVTWSSSLKHLAEFGEALIAS